MRRQPPGLLSVVVAVAITVWLLEEASRQIAFHFLTILIPPIFLVLIGHYLFCLFHVSPHLPDATPKAGVWQWAVLPVALFLTLSASVNPWPLVLRFALSRSAFEEKVSAIHQGLPYDSGPQRIGLYHVERIETMPNGYVGFVTGFSLADPVAICYDPTRPQSSRYNWRIVDRWYASEW